MSVGEICAGVGTGVCTCVTQMCVYVHVCTDVDMYRCVYIHRCYVHRCVMCTGVCTGVHVDTGVCIYTGVCTGVLYV